MQPAGHRVPAADGEDVSGVGVLTAAARPWESESCSSSPRCHQVTGAGSAPLNGCRDPRGAWGRGCCALRCGSVDGVLMGDHHCGAGSTGSPGGWEVTQGAAPVLPVPLQPPRGGDSGRPAARCPPGVRALPPHSPDPESPSLGQNGRRVPNARPRPQSCGKSSGLVLAHHSPVEDGFRPRCVCFWCCFGANASLPAVMARRGRLPGLGKVRGRRPAGSQQIWGHPAWGPAQPQPCWCPPTLVTKVSSPGRTGTHGRAGTSRRRPGAARVPPRTHSHAPGGTR